MIICVGEALIDMISEENGGALDRSRSFKAMPGGAPANVAIGCARQGVETIFLGRLSADPFGRMLMRYLSGHGVNTGHIAVDTEAKTTLAFVTLDEYMRPDFTFYRNNTADVRFRPEDVPPDVAARARILHFGTLSMTTGSAREATLLAVRTASKAGAIISFDPNFRPALWEPTGKEMLDALEEGLAHADVVKISDGEYEQITGSDKMDPAAVRNRFPRAALVLITEGEKGAAVISPNHYLNVPATGNIKPVDTTGAGDAFDAAFLMKLHERGVTKAGVASLGEEVLREMAVYANATAGNATRYVGAVAHWDHWRR